MGSTPAGKGLWAHAHSTLQPGQTDHFDRSIEMGSAGAPWPNPGVSALDSIAG